MAATLPLHSWRIVSLLLRDSLLRRFQSIDGNGSGLRAAVKTNPAAGTATP
jgi:hypothetical protein